MTEEQKPIVHELRAGDFILGEWRGMDAFPQDGHTVEVRARHNPEIVRAFWNMNSKRVELEPGSKLEGHELYEWREIPRE